ncbi:gas vesicle structural protein GvpA [Actinacidiphila acidipaludis]|uniref:Gas vesicle protein A n=1 Tax=Actinacidiphila acidipaludis TaxID=2873382 RepID=A0ABS7QE88_9ACTN|nr:gas vesicle structural protein GvpA [Streptomyces acidipaludis]MBY8881488.1 gas vesicle structural protein GvpA [Streptomyces acidipaludis]
MTTAIATQNGPSRSGGGGSGSLYDVLELILDRGLVIDAFVRVSLVGIEILKIDVRVVVASVDTYLRFAEACNRLDLESGPNKDPGLPDIVGSVTESGARGKTKGALAGAAETVSEAFRSKTGDDDKESAPRRRTSSSASARRRSSSSKEDDE